VAVAVYLPILKGRIGVTTVAGSERSSPNVFARIIRILFALSLRISLDHVTSFAVDGTFGSIALDS